MLALCNHYFSNRERCQSPACKGTRFCYWHRTALDRVARRDKFVPPPSPAARTGIHFAPLTSPENIRDGVEQLNAALLAKRIDEKRASLVLHGLQIAASVVRRS